MKENRNPSMSRSLGEGFPHVHRSIVVKISFFIAFAFIILWGLLTGYSIYSIQTASHNMGSSSCGYDYDMLTSVGFDHARPWPAWSPSLQL